MYRVRIQRKRKSNAQMLFAWTNFFMLIVRFLARPYIDEERARLTEAKYQRTLVQTRVDEQREHKLSNDVTIGDLKVEQLVMQNKILEAKLRALGVGVDFEANNYTSDRPN